jgi:hypothetical protein
LTLNGTVAPGSSTGTLTINGGLTMTSGVMEWELAALTTSGEGTNFDLLTSNGATTLGGTSQIAVSFIGAATNPNAGDAFWEANRQWLVLDASGGSLSGNFASIGNNTWWTGFFSLSSSGNQSFLNWNFSPVPEPSAFLSVGALGLCWSAFRRRKASDRS